LTADQGDAVQQAIRPFVTAGVAIAGASLIAVTPMTAPVPDIQTRDVALTSGEDTLPDLAAPWIDQFNTASDNATTLLNTFYDAPYIGLQQLIANDSGFLQDFFNDPTSNTLAGINVDIQDNLAAVLTGYALQNATPDTVNTVIAHTLEGNSELVSHAELFAVIDQFFPPSVNPAEVTPIIDFLASPLSGIIMGELGPDISPWIALSNSISAGDDFNDTLANMVGAYFNGADLSLNSLIPLIEQANVLPQGFNIENLEFAFGGLLTPGQVGGNEVPIGVGGSILNSLGIDLTGTGQTIDLTGVPVGPIGAWESWGQTIADLLGWDGSGSPLSDVTLPTIPADFLDGSTIPAAAADLSSLWQDFAAAF
jgi:hypothetical protein